MAVIFNREHDEHGSVSVGQIVDQRLERVHVEIVGVGVYRDDFGFGYIGELHLLSAPQEIDGFAHHDSAHPTFEIAFEPELREVCEYLRETSDHHVLGVMHVANVVAADAEHFGRMPSEELFLGFCVALEGLF